jgi:hypothetical protein
MSALLVCGNIGDAAVIVIAERQFEGTAGAMCTASLVKTVIHWLILLSERSNTCQVVVAQSKQHPHKRRKKASSLPVGPQPPLFVSLPLNLLCVEFYRFSLSLTYVVPRHASVSVTGRDKALPGSSSASPPPFPSVLPLTRRKEVVVVVVVVVVVGCSRQFLKR